MKCDANLKYYKALVTLKDKPRRMEMVESYKGYEEMLKEFYRFEQDDYFMRNEIISHIQDKDFLKKVAREDKNYTTRKKALMYLMDEYELLWERWKKDHSAEVRKYAGFLLQKNPASKRFILMD